MAQEQQSSASGALLTREIKAGAKRDDFLVDKSGRKVRKYKKRHAHN
jgi:hypothetical protein